MKLALKQLRKWMTHTCFAWNKMMTLLADLKWVLFFWWKMLSAACHGVKRWIWEPSLFPLTIRGLICILNPFYIAGVQISVNITPQPIHQGPLCFREGLWASPAMTTVQIPSSLLQWSLPECLCHCRYKAQLQQFYSLEFIFLSIFLFHLSPSFFTGIPEATEWPNWFFPEMGWVPCWLWEPGGWILAG